MIPKTKYFLKKEEMGIFNKLTEAMYWEIEEIRAKFFTLEDTLDNSIAGKYKGNHRYMRTTLGGLKTQLEIVKNHFDSALKMAKIPSR